MNGRAPQDIDLTAQPPPEQRAEEESLGELLGSLSRDVGELVRTQVELAVVEIKEEMQHAQRAAAFMATAGALGYLALAMLAVTAGFAIAEGLDLWASFGIVTIVLAAVAAVAYFLGRGELAETDAVPPQTKESLEEDAQWLRQRMS